MQSLLRYWGIYVIKLGTLKCLPSGAGLPLHSNANSSSSLVGNAWCTTAVTTYKNTTFDNLGNTTLPEQLLNNIAIFVWTYVCQNITWYGIIIYDYKNIVITGILFKTHTFLLSSFGVILKLNLWILKSCNKSKYHRRQAGILLCLLKMYYNDCI